MAKTTRHYRKRLSKKLLSKKKSRSKRRYATRKTMKGGTCYGRGVGSSNYDPNYSIYNTNMLKLFPYK